MSDAPDPHTPSAGAERARQHSIPAAYLGRFSNSTTGRSRTRPLWVRDVRAPRTFVTTAEKVSRYIGLYDLRDETTLDASWNYEDRLTSTITALADETRSLDGRLWLGVLVRFVAGLFVRWPDFEREFERRFDPALLEYARGIPDNATAARLIDYQQLLAPLMAARWTVVHFPAGADLITSDIGLAPTRNLGGVFGYVVPLDRSTALVVSECAERRIMEWSEGRWVAVVSHMWLDESDATSLNNTIAAWAAYAVFGATEASVADVSEVSAVASRPSPAIMDPIGRTDLMCHQYDYFRALSAASEVPLKAQAAADTVNWESIGDGDWSGKVVVEVLFPLRAVGGVTIDGFRMELSLAHGIDVQSDRHAVGDFRKGASVLMDFDRSRFRQNMIAGDNSRRRAPARRRAARE